VECEIGGAVKNVCLAAGMCAGLGLGTNTMSALVTRGCGEMRRLGLTLVLDPVRFLVCQVSFDVTCYIGLRCAVL
jgi:glycerol-3-phosphate dehydrogenase